jgi:hypothetical protein
VSYALAHHDPGSTTLSITCISPRRRSLLAVGLSALALAACGSDSTSSGSATTSPASARGPGTGRGFAQDPTVRACLQKQGIALPARRPGGRPPGAGGRRYGGAPPTGTTTTPRTGTNARPGSRGDRDPAQFAKLQAALKKCGVQMRGGRPGGAPPNGAPAQATPSASTS